MNFKHNISPPVSRKSSYLVITSEIIVPILIIILVITFSIFGYKSSYFNIKYIDCQKDYSPCSDESLLAELNRYYGAKIFKVNRVELEQKLLDSNKTLSKVNVNVSLPSTLKIDIVTAPPSVAIQVIGNNDTWIVLDESFRVIKVKNQDPNVPTVTVPSLENISIGKSISDNSTIKALEIALSIKNNYFVAENIRLEDGVIVLGLEGGKKALLSSDRDIREQLITLQAILTDDTILSEGNVIDVRFTQPVIKSE